MPRVAAYETAEHKALERAARRLDEYNDCGVKAVALTCGVTYSQARRAMRKAGRQHQEPSSPQEIEGAIIRLGWSADEIDPSVFVCRYRALYPGGYQPRSITTYHPWRFPEAWSGGRYLIFSCTHVVAVVGGTAHDCMAGHSLRADQVAIVYRG